MKFSLVLAVKKAKINCYKILNFLPVFHDDEERCLRSKIKRLIYFWLAMTMELHDNESIYVS